MLITDLENRNKGKKRKPESQINSRRQKEEEEDDENDAANVDEEDGEQDEDYDLQPNPNSNSVPSSSSRESGVVLGDGERLSSCPPVVKRLVNRLHSSVLSIAASEIDVERGESRNVQDSVLLENLSYGQLQSLSCYDGIAGFATGRGRVRWPDWTV